MKTASSKMLCMFLLSYLATAHSFHNVKTNKSDTIITYAGHVEADYSTPKSTNSTNSTIATSEVEETTTEIVKDDENTFAYPVDDEVIFIPNDKEVERVGDEFYAAPMHIGDMIDKKDVVDVMKDATEPTNPDILFITGKNAERDDLQPKKQIDKHMDTRRSGSEKAIEKKRKLDCHNLNCTNVLESICGAKRERSQWKYRLFLNDCYFRKVNCNFNYEENRYKEVSRDRCDTIAVHLKERPSSTPAAPAPSKQHLNFRRSYSSRRTLNLNINGQFCSHPCPGSCPDDYDPECAVSRKGMKKVFMNHCKLDMDSCFYGEIWQRRHLADCIGFKKADMRENRGFIAWMQRVGMVDKKGKLML